MSARKKVTTTRPIEKLSLTLVGLAAFSALAAAPQGRYVLTTDTVQDTVSGLLWQRVEAPSTYELADAKIYCSTLNLGGLTGWRLPRLKELQTLVDPRVPAPSIDATAFPKPAIGAFWSSTTLASDPESAFVIFFSVGPQSPGSPTRGGATGHDLETELRRVRCVR